MSPAAITAVGVLGAPTIAALGYVAVAWIQKPRTPTPTPATDAAPASAPPSFRDLAEFFTADYARVREERDSERTENTRLRALVDQLRAKVARLEQIIRDHRDDTTR